ncbi:MAG: acyl-CoA dehydrogenase [Alphaproteobacteria bacterium]
MSDYNPPIKDMQFLIHDVLGFTHEDLDRETTEAILGEAAKLASEVLAPINRAGDEHGAKLDTHTHTVTTAPGWKEAYAQYTQGGWNAVPFDEEFGGQNLPYALAFPIQEMWQGANMSFGLCPLLNQGAVEAIHHHGSDAQKAEYLPNLISGEWTGTMNLTEPHAGSDLGLLRTKADKQEDGTYKISGQKIWITYGEHDLTENIIHLVIAKTPDAGEDVKGISLFIVPKFLADGTRNDVKCVGLDHKLGIHASPTCVMQFGDEGGATGYLVGEEGQGLKYMFTMMNNARLSVGLQGVAIAERAYQHAAAYAAERVQGKSLSSGERVTIDQHKDVQRMLLTMQSQIEAGRALTLEAALAMDAGDSEKVNLLTPIVKAWCTDMAVEVTSLGVQIHGGCGFVEETGAAQFFRDARILPIYEGTNGIQALDLAFRKTLRDGGAATKTYIETIKERVSNDAQAFDPAIKKLESATARILELSAAKDLDTIQAMATPYLKGFGIIAAGSLLTQAAEKAQNNEDTEFATHKKRIESFYKSNILPFALAHLDAAINGADKV